MFLVQPIINGFLTKMSPCLVSSSVLCERLEERQRLKGELIDPRICSLPQVVFTVAFLKTLPPAPVCLLCCRLSTVLLELCSSGLAPPNLVKRKLVLYTDSLFRFSYYILPFFMCWFAWSSVVMGSNVGFKMMVVPPNSPKIVLIETFQNHVLPALHCCKGSSLSFVQ